MTFRALSIPTQKINEVCHMAKCHIFSCDTCDKITQGKISADYTNNIDIMFEAPIYMLSICSITHNMLSIICSLFKVIIATIIYGAFMKYFR